MSSDPISPVSLDARKQGSVNYAEGHAFESRVAEAYRLLGYRVEHGRQFSGRQVDIFLELSLGDLRVRRAVECKAGDVVAEDLDKFLLKLELVRKEYPDVQGTVVGGLSFTDHVAAHAAAIGLTLTLYRDLSASILDGPTYARGLVNEIESNDRYRPILFVEPLIGNDSTGASKKGFAAISDWLGEARWNQLTLLGDVGTGKSFLCRMIAYDLAKRYLERPLEEPLPLLIDLRKADREFSLEGLILTHFASHGLSRATFDIFQFLLSEGRIVLILDGFDEMASRVNPTITIRNFHELARSVTKRAKVCLTCRTHYFKSRTEEEEVVLGGSGPSSSDVARDLYWDLIARSGFKIAYLRPFAVGQVEEYVRRARPNDSADVLRKIRKIYNLLELSQRPLLLDMIVRSIDKFTTAKVTSADLYEVFTSAWIHRDLWRDLMRPEEKLKFLKALARSLWEQEATTVEYQKLQEYVGIELKSLIDSPQKLQELDGEIRTASFLIRDGRGHYGFAHSSYAEYFLARGIADQLTAQNLSALKIRRLTNEVVDFLISMVDKGELEDELSRILAEPYSPLLSENALVLLYRLRRNLIVEEEARGDGVMELRIEMPAAVQLQGAKLAQVNLEGAILHSARLRDSDLQQCVARGAELDGSDLAGANCSKGDFQGASLRGIDAPGASFAESNLHNADVTGSDFEFADLRASVFTVRTWAGATFDGALFDSAVTPSDGRFRLPDPKTDSAETQTGTDRERLLVWAYQRSRRYASRLGAKQDAHDIASDVVVLLLTLPNELNQTGNSIGRLATLVRTLTWRKVSALRASGLGRRDYPIEGMQVIDTFDEQSDDPDLEAADDEFTLKDLEAYLLAQSEGGAESRELLDTLGGVLAPEAMQLLIARYAVGESVQEIAGKLGISQVEVARRLNKARELAREVLWRD